MTLSPSERRAAGRRRWHAWAARQRAKSRAVLGQLRWPCVGQTDRGAMVAAQPRRSLHAHARVRHSPIKPDFSYTQSPATFIYRAGAAHIRSFLTGSTPERAAKAMLGDDGVTDIVLKAASQPAAISGTPEWAQSLAGVAIYDLIQSTVSLSAAADIIDRAFEVEPRWDRRTSRPWARAQCRRRWAVGRRRFARTGARTRLLECGDPAAAQAPSVHDLQPQRPWFARRCRRARAWRLTFRCFLPIQGDATKPPGLFAGQAPIGATAGGGTAAMIADIGNLFAALAAHSAGKTAVIVAAMPQAIKLKLTAGPKFDFDIIASTALATGTAAVIEVASFVSGFGSTAEFSTSKVGTIQSWLWTLAYGHHEDRTPIYGYAATREAAMAAFAKSWRRE